MRTTTGDGRPALFGFTSGAAPTVTIALTLTTGGVITLTVGGASCGGGPPLPHAAAIATQTRRRANGPFLALRIITVRAQLRDLSGIALTENVAKQPTEHVVAVAVHQIGKSLAIEFPVADPVR